MTTSTARHRTARLLGTAALGAIAATVLIAGPASAGSIEPIVPNVPIPGELADLQFPIDFAEMPTPDDDGPVVFDPPIVTFDIPTTTVEFPGGLIPVPICLPWDPAQTGALHSDPVGGTVSVMITYLGDAANTCDTLFVVHSIQLDDTSSPIGLLAEEHVSMSDLAAGGGSVTVTVPIDPCYARVFTDGPEAYVLADTSYGEGCPPETTEPTDPTVPTDPTDPTPGEAPTPPDVPFTGSLPETGASPATLGLVAGVLLASGIAIACAARGSQVLPTRHGDQVE